MTRKKKYKYCIHCDTDEASIKRLAKYEVFIAETPVGLCEYHYQKYIESEEINCLICMSYGDTYRDSE